MQSSFKIAIAGIAIAGLSMGCALIGPKGENTLASQPVGTTFVRAANSTGSYGSGKSQSTSTRMPKKMWQGKEVYVLSTSNGPDLLLTEGNGWVALVNGDKPIFSFDPPSGYDYPLTVGKSWKKKWNVTVHATKQVVPVESQVSVEAYEDVSTPAGTFKAFRIRSANNIGDDDVNWFSTEHAMFVKQKLTRSAKSPFGAGTRETELLYFNRGK